MVDLLDELADPDTIVLILDDMHWADPVTLEFLERSIRRPSRRPYLLALAMRPGQVADHLLDAQRMTGGPGVVIDLSPLGFAAADVLLPKGIAEADRRRIFAESGGDPMLLGELARTGAAGIVPGGVRPSSRRKSAGRRPLRSDCSEPARSSVIRSRSTSPAALPC